MLDILLTTVKDFHQKNIDCSIYLFGSYLKSDIWSDLDILVIYKNYNDIPKIKSIILKNIENTPLDLNFMSEDEEKYFNFINKTNAKQLFPINYSE